jgi:UDPglucose 6-dehydrogenase
VNVAVAGLWHLGTVTAACLAAAGHRVIGWDPDPAVVQGLTTGRIPVLEPGLAELVNEGLKAGRLAFEADASRAVADAEVVWITFDTPVDEQDRADPEAVLRHVESLLPHLAFGALVLVSSQLPVGSVGRLEQACTAVAGKGGIEFACCPENLRLGKAIEVFMHADRFVVGVRRASAKVKVEQLLVPLQARIEWMRVESAEMTKHAINAFLAVSVAFANEIGTLCEAVGADAREVARGLKTDVRIGSRAYVAPGAAFAGGTLARDLVFLDTVGRSQGVNTRLLGAACASNEDHKDWTWKQLSGRLGGNLRGRRIAMWGLTYKPGTDTLRRSEAVRLCVRLRDAGAEIAVHDPAVRVLPDALGSGIVLAPSSEAAARAAEALVLATEWPEYRAVDLNVVLASMGRRLVLDPGGFLESRLLSATGVEYLSVGRPTS